MKLCLISDTHEQHTKLNGKMPEADVLVCAGDFTMDGHRFWVQDFNHWLGTLQQYKYKIVIPGNHELTMDEKKNPSRYLDYRGLITNATLLVNQSCIIDGVKFYGMPDTPWFYDWAFNVKRGVDMFNVVNQIPDDTNVLISHGPPYGIMDTARDFGERGKMVFKNAGCQELRDVVDTLEYLKVHVFGHFHGPYGAHDNGKTKFFNASICDEKYRATREPFVVEI